MKIIDGDGHVFEDSEGLRKFLPSPFNEGRTLDRWFPPLDHFHAFIGETPPGSFRRDTGPDEWIAFMQDVGIDQAVLYTTSGLGVGKIFHRDWAIALCKAYNNWLHEEYIQRSPRFQGMALIPMQDAEAAADELARAVELGFCGAMLPSTGLPEHLGAKQYWPVYEAANRLGCCLGVHGGAHSGLGFDHMNNYTPVGGMGHPMGLLINFSGVLFNGLMDRYPNVKWGFMEGGVAWMEVAVERFERAHETHIQWNPRGELAPAADESVTEYIRKHVREGRLFVGCEGDEPTLAHASALIGSQAFVYSSDFPHEVNNEICKHEIEEMLECDDLSAEDKENILHGNAERFYNLKPEFAASKAATAAASR